MTQHIARFLSPIGRIEVVSNGAAITSLAIECDGRLPHDDAPERSDAVLDQAVQQLAEYFDGARLTFDLSVQLAGTPFQEAVWAELQRIPHGAALTYGELAATVGRPGAARAIGGAVGANPVPLIVGCHRVLGGNGRITGYSGGDGIPTKQWLLRHEHIDFRA
ncbi:MAG TPA: methylated-DNA--[protein]-cysteine S-methyltransferase [Candidatus Lumbricidophila sp.]|nr:methylated-DNA--[protein]-cysteine S-methyltransferase [Candidatus Lumbricidophila sp.]